MLPVGADLHLPRSDGVEVARGLRAAVVGRAQVVPYLVRRRRLQNLRIQIIRKQ